MSWEEIGKILSQSPETVALAGVSGGSLIVYGAGKYAARSESEALTNKELEEKMNGTVLEKGVLENIAAPYRLGKKKGYKSVYEERIEGVESFSRVASD